MHTIPFHRRILPIIFIIVFCAVAPALLFYTAGYRWNPKKGQVERNGTVILDTQPGGATITIDDRQTSDETPVTIQDMAPGLHRFQLSKDGYFSWSKSLDVYPEKVTFINDVWLWKKSTSTLLYTTAADSLSQSPDSQRLLLTANSSTQGEVLNLTNMTAAKLNFNPAFKVSSRPVWSDSDRYILSGSQQSDGQNWLIDAYASREPMQLMAGDYRWSGTDLVGNDGQTQFFLRTPDYGLTRNQLAKNQVDSSATAEIKHASGTADLVYVSLDEPDRGLILPPGNWKIFSVLKDHALLKDNGRWLSLEFKKTKPEYHAAQGDELRPLTIKKQLTYLLINGSELWVWNPLTEPELILRQSENIVGAAWHREGSNVFFATGNDVFALNLDTRDGRIITRLDSFDDIKGLSLNAKRLLILGRKGDQSGVWSLDVE